MSQTSLKGSCEETINTTLKRLSKLNGQDQKALKIEFREWLEAIESDSKTYDILYINKIHLNNES